MQKNEMLDDSEAMILTSMRIPKILHQGLMQKSREMGLSLSKTVGYLFDQSQKKPPLGTKPDYALLTYVLLQEAIHNFVENSQSFIDQAFEKAQLVDTPMSDSAKD